MALWVQNWTPGYPNCCFPLGSQSLGENDRKRVHQGSGTLIYQGIVLCPLHSHVGISMLATKQPEAPAPVVGEWPHPGPRKVQRFYRRPQNHSLPHIVLHLGVLMLTLRQTFNPKMGSSMTQCWFSTSFSCPSFLGAAISWGHHVGATTTNILQMI